MTEFKWLCVVIILVLVITAGWFVAPKKHLGYYMLVGNNESFTTYRVMNNWSNWPDNTAYRTADKKEAYQKFDKMRLLN